jgi:hypothetical protein
MSPPCIHLVEAFLAVYRERVALDVATAAALTRRITTLYEAARTHAEREKQRQREAAAQAGRRGVSWTEIRERDRRIAALDTKLTRSVAELEATHQRVHDLDVRHDEHVGRLA